MLSRFPFPLLLEALILFFCRSKIAMLEDRDLGDSPRQAGEGDPLEPLVRISASGVSLFVFCFLIPLLQAQWLTLSPLIRME